jgi:hypothetical protein
VKWGAGGGRRRRDVGCWTSSKLFCRGAAWASKLQGSGFLAGPERVEFGTSVDRQKLDGGARGGRATGEGKSQVKRVDKTKQRWDAWLLAVCWRLVWMPGSGRVWRAHVLGVSSPGRRVGGCARRDQGAEGPCKCSPTFAGQPVSRFVQANVLVSHSRTQPVTNETVNSAEPSSAPSHGLTSPLGIGEKTLPSLLFPVTLISDQVHR